VIKGQEEGYAGKRIPSYCDRVLFASLPDRASAIQLRSYASAPAVLSRWVTRCRVNVLTANPACFPPPAVQDTPARGLKMTSIRLSLTNNLLRSRTHSGSDHKPVFAVFDVDRPLHPATSITTVEVW
jgi:hypothetical protein